MPSEFEQLSDAPSRAVSSAEPNVTWEYLEAHAAHFAKKMGEPTPQLVMKEGLYKANLALLRGTVPLDPGVLAILNLEESAFYVAYMMMLTTATSERLHSPSAALGLDEQTLPSTAKYMLTVVLAMVALAIVWTVASFTFPAMLDSRYQILRHVVLLLLENVVLISALTKYIRDRGAPNFRGAAFLTGNPAAGRSFLRKMRVFYRTGRGTKPLTAFRRLWAQWEVYISVPKT